MVQYNHSVSVSSRSSLGVTGERNHDNDSTNDNGSTNDNSSELYVPTYDAADERNEVLISARPESRIHTGVQVTD